MSLVGIIVNPDSGRDVRRIVSHAIAIGTDQKANIVARLLIGLGVAGVDHVEIMPDRFGIGRLALDELADQSFARFARPIDMPTTWSATDTLTATATLRDRGAGCIIVLGGDGTCRLVAKACAEVPILPISTGTNNVVPDFVEGTIGGLAAGYIAQHPEQRAELCWRHKRLIVHLGDVEIDHALVDIALVDKPDVGAKAVWDASTLKQLFVTRSHVTRIGLSSVLGRKYPVAADAPFGAVVRLNDGDGERILAPVVPGGFAEVTAGEPVRMEPDRPVSVLDVRPASLSLDGEREITLHTGTSATITLDMNGPWIVDVERALNRAAGDERFVYRGL